MASVFPWADSTLPMSQRQQLLGAALVEGSPDIPTWLATRLPDLTSDQLVTLAAELCSQAKMVGEEKMAQWLRTASPKALGAAAQWLHADNPTNWADLTLRTVNTFGRRTAEYINKVSSTTNTSSHDATFWLPEPGKDSSFGPWVLDIAWGGHRQEKLVAKLHNIAGAWETITSAGQPVPETITDAVVRAGASSLPVGGLGQFGQTYEKFHGSKDFYMEALECYISSFTTPQLPTPRHTYQAGGYSGGFLDRADPKGLLLGQITNCCQSIGDAGGYSAAHGQSNRNGTFYTIRNADGVDVAQAWVWVHPETGEWYFDSVEMLASRPSVMVEGLETENDVREWLSDLSQEVRHMKIEKHGDGFLVSTENWWAQDDLALLTEYGKYDFGGVVAYTFVSPAENARIQAVADLVTKAGVDLSERFGVGVYVGAGYTSTALLNKFNSASILTDATSLHDYTDADTSLRISSPTLPPIASHLGKETLHTLQKQHGLAQHWKQVEQQVYYYTDNVSMWTNGVCTVTFSRGGDGEGMCHTWAEVDGNYDEDVLSFISDGSGGDVLTVTDTAHTWEEHYPGSEPPIAELIGPDVASAAQTLTPDETRFDESTYILGATLVGYKVGTHLWGRVVTFSHLWDLDDSVNLARAGFGTDHLDVLHPVDVETLTFGATSNMTNADMARIVKHGRENLYDCIEAYSSGKVSVDLLLHMSDEGASPYAVEKWMQLGFSTTTMVALARADQADGDSIEGHLQWFHAGWSENDIVTLAQGAALLYTLNPGAALNIYGHSPGAVLDAWATYGLDDCPTMFILQNWGMDEASAKQVTPYCPGQADRAGQCYHRGASVEDIIGFAQIMQLSDAAAGYVLGLSKEDIVQYNTCVSLAHVNSLCNTTSFTKEHMRTLFGAGQLTNATILPLSRCLKLLGGDDKSAQGVVKLATATPPITLTPELEKLIAKAAKKGQPIDAETIVHMCSHVKNIQMKAEQKKPAEEAPTRFGTAPVSREEFGAQIEIKRIFRDSTILLAYDADLDVISDFFAAGKSWSNGHAGSSSGILDDPGMVACLDGDYYNAALVAGLSADQTRAAAEQGVSADALEVYAQQCREETLRPINTQVKVKEPIRR